MKKIALIMTLTLILSVFSGCAQVIEDSWKIDAIQEIDETINAPSYTEEPTPETQHTSSGSKPSGLELNPDRLPTIAPYESSNVDPDVTIEPEVTIDPGETTQEPDVTLPPVDVTTPEPTKQTEPIQEVDLTSGLKNALTSFGKTTKDGINVVIYSSLSRKDGGLSIIHISSNASTGIQKLYFYYESSDNYNAAKSDFPADSCNDDLRLILKSVSEVAPVTDPSSLSYVIFDGYEIW